MTFRTFQRDERGSMAVEGALALSVLSVVLVGIVGVGGAASAKNVMANALRFSAQYVANGGSDLTVAESVFENTYGPGYDSFASVIECSCAPSRSEIDDSAGKQTANANGQRNAAEQDENASQQGDNANTANAQDSTGAWGQCSIDCGADPIIKYLRLSASDSLKPIFGGDPVYLEEVVYVRVE